MAAHEVGSGPPEGSPTLAPWPKGTRKVTVGRLVAATHRQGGARRHLGTVPPEAVEAFLAAQGPGRYWIGCLGPGGHVLPGGAFAVEIGVDTPQPRVVPARTSRDYAAKGSPLAVARRKERQAAQRVDAMRKTVRAVEGENIRLRAEASVKEARDLAERHRAEGTLGRLHDEVQRLTRQVDDLRADLERSYNELRAYVDVVVANRGLIGEESGDEVSSLHGTPAAAHATTLEDQEVGDDRPGQDGSGARRAGEVGGEPKADRGNRARGRAGQDRGLSALANVRNVASDGQQRKPEPSVVDADGPIASRRLVSQATERK